MTRGVNKMITASTTTKPLNGVLIPTGTTAFAVNPQENVSPTATIFTFQIDVPAAAGTLTALSVTILGSIDGVSFYPTGVVFTTVGGGLATYSLGAIKYVAAAITALTVNTGTPTVTVSVATPN